MTERLDEIEAQAGSKVRGYYLVPEGSWTMYNEKATDGTYCRDNVKQIVSDVKALNKYALWIPVEADLSFNWMDQCQSYIGFTNVTPQPHYYKVKDNTGSKQDENCNWVTDAYRPNGMTFDQLKTFMQNCKSRGWGVESESDNKVRSDTEGGSRENCGCQCLSGEDLKCRRRAANYYCAADAVGGFSYVYHYFSDDIGNYVKVRDYYNSNTCPTSGYSTC